jgi:glutaminyl-tRNA synthetase
METPVKGFHRLVPGGEVRLRGAGILKCDAVIKDGDAVVELRCTLDPESRPGMEGANRKVKGTIHWVCGNAGIKAEVRLYDRLFSVENPDNDEGGKTYRDHLNPDSVRVVTGYIEPAAAVLANESAVQFERLGYFAAERYDHAAERPVFNRTVTLRDSWAAKGA